VKWKGILGMIKKLKVVQNELKVLRRSSEVVQPTPKTTNLPHFQTSKQFFELFKSQQSRPICIQHGNQRTTNILGESLIN
jgi:hypothetical protein